MSYCSSREIRRARTAPAAEAILRFHLVPPVTGGDHPRFARGQGHLCAAADRRRQITLLPIAGARARRTHRRRLTADRVDERPGGRAASQRHRGNFSKLVPRGGRRPRPSARPAQWRIPPALRRAGAADAFGIFVRPATLERPAHRD